MNRKIYLSGKITDDPDYIAKFNTAADQVQNPLFCEQETPLDFVMRYNRIKRFVPVNPVNLRLCGKSIKHYPWRVAMCVCLWHLVWCSHVYMLDDWRHSRGARIEHLIASLLNKNIIYQK